MASPKLHSYSLHLRWTGNLGEGTRRYADYSRDHEINGSGKPTLFGSSDRAFRGDPGRYSPEDLLVASLAACHMLWYLHLCAEARILVTAYVDSPHGRMLETEEGAGHFSEVTLRPQVTISAASDQDLAEQLHARAHAMCFIASSVRFPVRCEPRILPASE